MRYSVAIALICLMLLPGQSRADDRSDIQSLFNRIARSMMAKDAAGVMAAGTSGMTYIEKGKTLVGGQIMRKLESRFRLMQGPPQCRLTIVSLQLKGRSATVTTSDFTEAQLPSASGREHHVTVTGRTRNTLVKTKLGWKIHTVFVVTETMMMDGHPINSSPLD